MDEQAKREMPKYKCHKEVWALKIAEISFKDDGTATIIPEDKNYGVIVVDAEYVRKHKPQANGYYVVYEGGYKSWSPKEAFESGYKEVLNTSDKIKIARVTGESDSV
jgi:hypothetical protein